MTSESQNSSDAAPNMLAQVKNFFRRLTEPSARIFDLAQRRRAQLLSLILLCLFILFLSINIGYALTVPGYRLPPADLIGYGVLAFTYALSRSRYTQATVFLLLAMFVLNVFQNILTGTSVNIQVTLSFLIPSYVLASIFLNPFWATVYGVGINGLVALLPILAPERFEGFSPLIGAVSVGMVVVVMCLIWTFNRNRIENDHRAALVDAYNTTLEGWSNALEIRDKETIGHSRRVTELSLNLGQLCGLEGDELEWVRRGSLLHDIGKMFIPDSILMKNSELDDEEWKVMRTHPQIARDVLATVSYLKPALEIPVFHHEWWNGKGYPYGLQGDQIPLSARIFAVVDVWDALLSDRPYRHAWTREQVIKYIKDQSGKQFDPQIVDKFFELGL
jgi:HD-GYP domain-containing protein (c-di-GMP phosphodiesterase class II)